MNERYLFRGKRKDNGEWAYGGLDTDWGLEPEKRDRYWIIQAYLGEAFVLPETVGQCTGLRDKNGNWIFEGDIIKINSRVASSETRETAETEIGFVKYDMDECEYRITNVNGTIEEYGKNYSLNLWRFKRDTNEVIGNIHDNPELLEVFHD